MAQIETWLRQELMEAVKVRYLDGNIFSQDNMGNLIGVELTQAGAPYSGGGSVSATVIRADGTTVAIIGSISGDKVSIILPQAAYYIPGVVSVVIKITSGSTITTVGAIVANVYESTTSAVIDPGTIIPSIETLIQSINTAVASIPADYSSLWASLAPAFSSSTSYTAGQYVTYNGGLYRFVADHSGSWSASDVAAATLGSGIDALKNAIVDINEFCRKEITEVTEGTLNTTAGSDIFSGTHLVNVSIPSGTAYKFKLQANGNISKYHLYANGSAIKYNCEPDTVYDLTASSNITYLSIYSTGAQVTGTGTIKGIVTVTTETENSLEERIEGIESDITDINENIDDIEESISDVTSLIKTNVLYDEATKVVSGSSTYVYEDIFQVTQNVREGDIYTFSIGSVTGNNATTVAYIYTFDSNGTRKRQVPLATNTSLTGSVTVESGEVRVVFTLYPSYTGACTATYTNVKIYKGTSEQNYIDPDYIWSDEIQEDVEEIAQEKVDSALADGYFDYAMADRYDPNAAEVNKYINPGTGSANTTTGYYATDYMEIRSGETLYYFRRDTLAAVESGFFAGYDKDKNFVPGSGGTNSSSYTQSGDVAYVRASFAYQTSYYNTRPEGLFVVATNKPQYAPGMITDPIFTPKYEKRKDVYIYSTDTESEIIKKLVDAYNTGNCDVHFERAHYTFGTYLPTVKTTYKLNENEIPVGNSCRYYFNGATIEATIDLQAYGSDYYCNLFGCQRSPSSFEMYDGILIATDTRYVVHDEASGYTATYRHVYRNMFMQYITGTRTDVYRKCIGGGTGKNGVIDIDGCRFITDGQEPDVSYHGNGTDVPGSEFLVNVRNSWFSKTFAANELSANQTAKILFAGNSIARALITYARWDVTSFLNEVRT